MNFKSLLRGSKCSELAFFFSGFGSAGPFLQTNLNKEQRTCLLVYLKLILAFGKIVELLSYILAFGKIKELLSYIYDMVNMNGFHKWCTKQLNLVCLYLRLLDPKTFKHHPIV